MRVGAQDREGWAALFYPVRIVVATPAAAGGARQQQRTALEVHVHLPVYRRPDPFWGQNALRCGPLRALREGPMPSASVPPSSRRTAHHSGVRTLAPSQPGPPRNPRSAVPSAPHGSQCGRSASVRATAMSGAASKPHHGFPDLCRQERGTTTPVSKCNPNAHPWRTVASWVPIVGPNRVQIVSDQQPRGHITIGSPSGSSGPLDGPDKRLKANVFAHRPKMPPSPVTVETTLRHCSRASKRS